jgi:hypothetical protein
MHHTTIIVSISVISCIFSSFVILTYFAFNDMRKKLFMKYIFYIAVSDFFVAIASTFGFPPNGSSLCWIQGAMAMYFPLASWFWTTMLSYTIYSIILNGKIIFPLWIAHVICWGLPLILTILPIASTTAVFGRPDNSNHYQWCMIVDKSDHNKPVVLWAYLSFFGWLFLCVALMTLWGLLSHLSSFQHPLTDVVHQTNQKIRLYPVWMSACWTANFLCTCVIPGSSDGALAVASMSVGVSYGIVSSSLFLYFSEEAQQRWLSLLRKGGRRGKRCWAALRACLLCGQGQGGGQGEGGSQRSASVEEQPIKSDFLNDEDYRLTSSITSITSFSSNNSTDSYVFRTSNPLTLLHTVIELRDTISTES